MTARRAVLVVAATIALLLIGGGVRDLLVVDHRPAVLGRLDGLGLAIGLAGLVCAGLWCLRAVVRGWATPSIRSAAGVLAVATAMLVVVEVLTFGMSAY